MIEKVVREWKKVYENDLDHLVNEFRDSLTEKAVVILDGSMGAGKTTFVKKCLEEDTGMSPTYSILSECGDILHADFYRIESDEDVLHLEMGMYIEDKSLFMVEWGRKYIHRIEKEIPDDFSFYLLEIDMINDDKIGKGRRNYRLSEIEDI
jgi:tRNA threonylcarbamoyladenosine biosynthesis protein TsaE